MTLTFQPTPQGIANARRRLDELEREMSVAWTAEMSAAQVSTPPQSLLEEPAVRVYRQTVENGLSRELLEKLPGGREHALLPEEIGDDLLESDRDGNAIGKASVRAIYRNIRRAEAHLKAQGVIDREVVLVDFSRYDNERAGRYYLSEHDRRVLDAYLRG